MDVKIDCPPPFRTSRQPWFRPALALLLSVPFILPGGVFLTGLAQAAILSLIGVPWVQPALRGSFVFFVVLRATCVVPLWLAATGIQRVGGAVKRGEISAEAGRCPLKVARAATIIVVISLIASTALYAAFPSWWVTVCFG